MDNKYNLQISTPFEELDRGFEFYAPQKTIDDNGRRILIAWMGVPEQYEDKHPTVKHKWLHAMTLPRELTIKDGKVYQTPITELEILREEIVHQFNLSLKESNQQVIDMDKETAELLLEVNDQSTERLEISIRGEVRLIFNKEKKVFTFERRSFVDGLMERRQCELKSLQQLQVLLDASTIEVFVNNGEEVFTARMFPYKENKQVKIGSFGKTTINFSHWSLKSHSQIFSRGYKNVK